MIDYIKGEIAELTPTIAVLELSGIGYELYISLNTYTAIQHQRTAKLYVYESIREDAHLLFGFYEKQERELFIQLISVSGIGGNTARMVLSSFTPAELSEVISSGNEKLLKSVKGIGLKTAQRILVELKDKVKLFPTAGGGSVTLTAPNSELMSEAVQALVMLGFAAAPSAKVVQSILKDDPTATVEKVIKTALKQL